MLEYWYQALNSRFGIKLCCDNVERLQQKLYALRREAGDPTLADLSLVLSPTDPRHLWIVKKKPGVPNEK